MADPDGFSLRGEYGKTYREFLKRDLKAYPALHGQVTGPVNLGFRVNDEDGKPIIYDDNIRGLLFDFIQRKFNTQYRELQKRNGNAFVWLDEPGLIWVFSGLSGYNDVQAKRDYHEFLTGLEGLTGLHLCSNINLTYLLEIGTDLLSFDAYQLGEMPKGYAESVAAFIRRGGIISWGIVPTDPAVLGKESAEKLAERVRGYWQVVTDTAGIPLAQLAAQALLAPAKCCVKSLEFSGEKPTAACALPEKDGQTAEQQSVAQAYGYLREVSRKLRKDFGF
ncbi:MAG: hypothetical protein ABID87_07735, partial [Chloroflexota bacterium]